MRATGFGFKSPKDFTGDYRYPQRKADGTILDMNYKSIGERRREILFMKKHGLDNKLSDEETAHNTLTHTINAKMGTINSNMSTQKQKNRNIKDLVGRQFSTFSKTGRFAYQEMANKRLHKNIGPGSYNSNPFLNIEATVNASHHIFGFPLIGKPIGNKDEAYTACEGAIIFDDRFATLKYKQQQQRTAKEADLQMKNTSIESRTKKTRNFTANGERPPPNATAFQSIKDVDPNADPIIHNNFVDQRLKQKSPSRQVSRSPGLGRRRAKSIKEYQTVKSSMRSGPYGKYHAPKSQLTQLNNIRKSAGYGTTHQQGINVEQVDQQRDHAANIEDHTLIDQNIHNIQVNGNNDLKYTFLNENSQNHQSIDDGQNQPTIQNEIKALKLQTGKLSRKNERELNRIKGQIMNMKIKNFQQNVNSPMHRINQIRNPQSKKSRRKRNVTTGYTSGGMNYNPQSNNYLSEYKIQKNPYTQTTQI